MSFLRLAGQMRVTDPKSLRVFMDTYLALGHSLAIWLHSLSCKRSSLVLKQCMLEPQLQPQNTCKWLKITQPWDIKKLGFKSSHTAMKFWVPAAKSRGNVDVLQPEVVFSLEVLCACQPREHILNCHLIYFQTCLNLDSFTVVLSQKQNVQLKVFVD